MLPHFMTDTATTLPMMVVFTLTPKKQTVLKKRTRINPESIALNQGSENAGKVLGIDKNGNVTPVVSKSFGSILKWGDLNGVNE